MKVLRSFLAASILFISFLTPAFSQTIANSSVSLPLAFEVNRGQTASQVTYLARSREGTIFLTKDGATVAIAGEGSFRLGIEGASTPGAIEHEQELRSRSNYLGGKQSFSGIKNYGAVLYRGVYPGIDIRFYGREQHLEHDFMLTRGADPDAIALTLEGIDKLSIKDDGVVEFKLGALYLNESAPVAWQEIEGMRVSVPVKWRLLGKNRLGFMLGSYDHTQPLTIDPVLALSTHIGGATAQLQTDFGIKTAAAQTAVRAVATDAAGNIYVSGFTSAVDFPLTAGSYDHTPKFPFFGGHDPDISSGMGFISKFDKTGQTLIYSTYLRDVGIKYLAVDGVGHAYGLSDIAGDLAGGDGVFIDKLNTDGGSLLYSFMFGAAPPNTCLGAAGGNASASGIAVDDAGNVWIAGTTPNLCLGTTPGAFQTAAPNKLQAGFAAKLDSNKSGAASIVYSTYLGGSTSDFVSGFAVDGSGNAYLIGYPSADFPHSAVLGTAGPTTFIAKLSADGSRLLFSTFLQGGLGQAITVDSSSNAYVSGYTLSSVFPTTANALRTKPDGLCDSNGVSAGTTGPCSDAFVTKLNSNGDAFVYSTLLGGSGTEWVQGMRVNAAGQV
ncbi:MAG TPA: SBBP repeat-containing protein, partial [Candidatus Angelobacter sp.]